MNKVMKMVSILLMAVMLTATLNTVCFALTPGEIQPGTAANTGDLQKKAGNILATIRNIAAIISVILIAILGIKFMMGSTEEKAEYKKSFIPLVVGMVVVLAATTIAQFIWSMAA